MARVDLDVTLTFRVVVSDDATYALFVAPSGSLDVGFVHSSGYVSLDDVGRALAFAVADRHIENIQQATR